MVSRPTRTAPSMVGSVGNVIDVEDATLGLEWRVEPGIAAPVENFERRGYEGRKESLDLRNVCRPARDDRVASPVSGLEPLPQGGVFVASITGIEGRHFRIGESDVEKQRPQLAHCTELQSGYAMPDVRSRRPQSAVISTGSQPNARFAMKGIKIAGRLSSLSLSQQMQRVAIRSSRFIGASPQGRFIVNRLSAAADATFSPSGIR